MTIEHETTPDDIEALRDDSDAIDARALASGNPDGQRPFVVSAAECADWRRRAAAGESYRDIRATVDADIAPETIGYHVREDCSH